MLSQLLSLCSLDPLDLLEVFLHPACLLLLLFDSDLLDKVVGSLLRYEYPKEASLSRQHLVLLTAWQDSEVSLSLLWLVNEDRVGVAPVAQELIELGHLLVQVLSEGKVPLDAEDLEKGLLEDPQVLQVLRESAVSEEGPYQLEEVGAVQLRGNQLVKSHVFALASIDLRLGFKALSDQKR